METLAQLEALCERLYNSQDSVERAQAERNYLINYLATKGPELETFVLVSLIQLFCHITKFGWLEDERFRDVVKDATNFLAQAQYHYAIGLKILYQLVSEINQVIVGVLGTKEKELPLALLINM